MPCTGTKNCLSKKSHLCVGKTLPISSIVYAAQKREGKETIQKHGVRGRKFTAEWVVLKVTVWWWWWRRRQ